MSLPNGRYARGRLRIQNMPFVLAAGTFGANHGTALFGPPTTCNMSQCTYRWRNHETRCARSNNDVVVAGFEIFLLRGLICCDCEDLICDRRHLGHPGAERGFAVKECRAADLAGQQLPLQQGETHTV